MSWNERYTIWFVLMSLLVCLWEKSSAAWLSSPGSVIVSSSASAFHRKQRLNTPLRAHFQQEGSERTDGKVTTLSGIDRVFCLSDLHCDNTQNLEWIQSKLDDSDFSKRDLIIVAGDISHDTETFRHTLSVLVEKAQVFFVPGNHEAWIDRRHKPKSTSFEKLEEVYEACHDLGVYTKSLLVQNDSKHCPCPLWIIPLESWYDGTLSFNDELCSGFDKWPWVDFQRCVWPADYPLGPKGTVQSRLPLGLVEDFLKRNKPILQNSPFPSSVDGPEPETIGIMTVSHFLPNKYCLPDWKDLDDPEFRDEWLDHGAGGMSAKFALVAGTSLLDQQIRTLLPAMGENVDKRLIHVFGHSHRPKDFEFNHVRYIHNPLGKPRERQMYMVSPDVDFQLIWDTGKGEIPGKQIIRLWDEQGGGLEALQRRMQEHRPRSRYNKHLKYASSSPPTTSGKTPGGQNTTSVQTQESRSR